MTISIIAARAKNGVIGVKNQLPWNIGEDMAYFKEKTIGKSIIMGQKTFESIGRALPERKNIVLTRDDNFFFDGITIARSIDEALSEAGDGEVMIIGGASLYQQFLPMAQRVYLTEINQEFNGDTFFPELDDSWREVSRLKGRGDGGLDYDFVVFEKLID